VRPLSQRRQRRRPFMRVFLALTRYVRACFGSAWLDPSASLIPSIDHQTWSRFFSSSDDDVPFSSWLPDQKYFFQSKSPSLLVRGVDGDV